MRKRLNNSYNKFILIHLNREVKEPSTKSKQIISLLLNDNYIYIEFF